MTVLRTLFAWPDGIVVGNLIASALWATPALVHLHRKLDRHHREHLAAIRGDEEAPPRQGAQGRRSTLQNSDRTTR